MPYHQSVYRNIRAFLRILHNSFFKPKNPRNTSLSRNIPGQIIHLIRGTTRFSLTTLSLRIQTYAPPCYDRGYRRSILFPCSGAPSKVHSSGLQVSPSHHRQLSVSPNIQTTYSFSSVFSFNCWCNLSTFQMICQSFPRFILSPNFPTFPRRRLRTPPHNL